MPNVPCLNISTLRELVSHVLLVITRRQNANVLNSVKAFDLSLPLRYFWQHRSRDIVWHPTQAGDSKAKLENLFDRWYYDISNVVIVWYFLIQTKLTEQWGFNIILDIWRTTIKLHSLGRNLLSSTKMSFALVNCGAFDTKPALDYLVRWGIMIWQNWFISMNVYCPKFELAILPSVNSPSSHHVWSTSDNLNQVKCRSVTISSGLCWISALVV